MSATVTMRSASDGGRKTAAGLNGEYHPHLRVRGHEALLGVTFHSDASDLIHPGERTTVVLVPLYEIDYSALRPGVEFDVLEGPQVVGTGTVE